MPPLDLTDDEHAEIVRLLRATIEADRFPLSPRLQAILPKLDPPAPRAEPLSPPKPPGERRAVLAKKRQM
jgi:hypothetical protein